MVETGTDVAAVAAGDVEALRKLLESSDLDAWLKERAAAEARGDLWRTDTGSDGTFLVELLVDEEPRVDLKPFLRDPVTVPRFNVPSGKLLVAGEECFAHPPRAPVLGRTVETRSGTFELVAFRTEYSNDDPGGTRFWETAPADERRAWSIGSALGATAVAWTLLGIFAAVVIFGGIGSLAYALVAVGTIPIVWFVSWLSWQLPAYKRAEMRHQGCWLEFPSVVLVLRSVATENGKHRD